MSIQLAAIAAGSIAVGDLLGRTGIAVIGDKYDRINLLTITFFLQALGILALPLINFSLNNFELGYIPLPIFVIGYGVGFGASIPLRLTLLADYFGRTSYGSIVGLTASIASKAATATSFNVTSLVRISAAKPRPSYST